MRGVGGYAETGALTPRMLDVLRCSARGLGASATADELGVSRATVRTLRAALLARLESPNIAAAIDTAWRRGLL
jgi:DNA-binding CsgD family transcriptional regulator